MTIAGYNVSAAFVAAKEYDLSNLPEDHKQLLAKQKFRIELHKDIWSYDKRHGTRYATNPVDGYKAGYTGVNVDVFFDPDNKTLAAMEFFKPINLNRIISTGYVPNPPARFKHEFGHAYSMARNYDIELDAQVMNKV